jgi:hypothetical protein
LRRVRPQCTNATSSPSPAHACADSFEDAIDSEIECGIGALAECSGTTMIAKKA